MERHRKKKGKKKSRKDPTGRIDKERAEQWRQNRLECPECGNPEWLGPKIKCNNCGYKSEEILDREPQPLREALKKKGLI